jgi:hypothetical protein
MSPRLGLQHFMVLIRCTPRLTIDNNFNGLCDVFDEFVGLEVTTKQMVQNMQLIVVVHRLLLENVEHVQKKQRKTHVTCKGLQTFDGFESDNKVKMHRLGKNKSLMCNWEGPYMFVDYKDMKGLQEKDHGSRICIVKNLKEQHWEHARKDLQLYHSTN